MIFHVKPNLIVYQDHEPRSSVGMSLPNGTALQKRDDACSASDADRVYLWAFQGALKPGERVAFTADGFRCTGEMGTNGQISVVPTPVRVYVGAGCDAPGYSGQGWICNDIAEAAAIYPGITLIGPCWNLPLPSNSVDEIMAKGMIEHLTYHEVARAFREWLRVLKPGGFFTGEVPDVDEYIREYLKMHVDPKTAGGEGYSNADGEPADHSVCHGPERWLRRALYGWQRWPGDEHRSGWNERLFKFYIENYFGGRYEIRRMAINFDEDVPGPQRVRHLWARAWK